MCISFNASRGTHVVSREESRKEARGKTVWDMRVVASSNKSKGMRYKDLRRPSLAASFKSGKWQ